MFKYHHLDVTDHVTKSESFVKTNSDAPPLYVSLQLVSILTKRTTLYCLGKQNLKLQASGFPAWCVTLGDTTPHLGKNPICMYLNVLFEVGHRVNTARKLKLNRNANDSLTCEITDEVSFGRRDHHLHLCPQMKQA